MKPILYDITETSFTSNGLGRLTDAISCTVTEERNGEFELEMEYPVSGKNFSAITPERIILATPADGKDPQPFRIYQIERDIDGTATVHAQHISYQLTKMQVMPCTAGSCTAALQALASNSATTCPFTFWTNKDVTGTFSVTVPKSIRSALAGEEGSILDVYGTGEYEFDKYTVKLYQHRGQDTDIILRYGKNLTDLEHTTDVSGTYTGIVPYWYSEEEGILTLPEKVVYADSVTYPTDKVVSVDFSSRWQDKPSVANLRTAAQTYVNSNSQQISTKLRVSFVQLWQTEEYKDVAALQRLNLCDTVRVLYGKLGVDARLKIVKTVYDVLRERYEEMELGMVESTLAEVISAVVVKDVPSMSVIEQEITRASELIKGGLGGHVVIGTNEEGKPNEILIMDTDSTSTAVNVIRLNAAGIGFSTTGYDGTYTNAWTIDGNLVADFITTGTLNANLIKAGVLADVAGKNSINMVTGEISLSSSASVGSSTIATTANVASAKSEAQTYAESQAGAAETAAKSYTDSSLVPYSTTTEMNSAISSSAEGIRTEVSQTYATKTYTDNKASTAEDNANAYTDGLLESYSTTAQMNSAISQSASAIETSVSQTYTTKAEYAALSVGGTNLLTKAILKNTDAGYKTNVIYYQGWSDMLSGFGLIYAADTSATQIYDSGYTLMLKPSKDYTLSFVLWGGGTQSGSITITADFFKTGLTLPSKTFTVGSQQKVSFTFSSANFPSNDKVALRIYCNATHDGVIAIADLKLEEGNVATQWSPAPEDVIGESEQYTESRITQTAGEIRSEVSTSINAISSSGMNMISKGMLNGDSGTLTNAVFEEDLTQTISGYGISLTPSVSDSQLWASSNLTVLKNTDYTFSFMCWNMGADAGNITVHCDLAPDTLPEFTFEPTREPIRYHFTFNSDLDDMATVRARLFCTVSHLGKIYFADIKFAEGADSYAWTPYPEDYVENDKVISAIIQTPETIKIQANKISLEGIITDNQGFSVSNGYVTMKDAQITCGNTSSGGFTIGWDEHNQSNALATYSTDGQTSSFFRLGGLDFHTTRSDGVPYNKYIDPIHSLGFLLLMSYTYGNVNKGVSMGVGMPGNYSKLFEVYREGNVYAHVYGGLDANGAITCNTLSVSSTKSRKVTTEDYSDRLLYCYEMPSPIFGDLGDGTIGDDGLCYVSVDPVFAETIQGSYQVFVQAYGPKSVYVTERKGSYFVVSGEPGTEFAWELKAKQIGTGSARLEKELPAVTESSNDEVIEASQHIEEINKQRGTTV